MNEIFTKVLILDFIRPNNILTCSNIFFREGGPFEKHAWTLQPGVKMILRFCHIFMVFSEYINFKKSVYMKLSA